jgi:hypothetical protein
MNPMTVHNTTFRENLEMEDRDIMARVFSPADDESLLEKGYLVERQTLGVT